MAERKSNQFRKRMMVLLDDAFVNIPQFFRELTVEFLEGFDDLEDQLSRCQQELSETKDDNAKLSSDLVQATQSLGGSMEEIKKLQDEVLKITNNEDKLKEELAERDNTLKQLYSVLCKRVPRSSREDSSETVSDSAVPEPIAMQQIQELSPKHGGGNP